MCFLSIYAVSHIMDGGLLKGPAREQHFLFSFQGAIIEVIESWPCESRRT